MSAPKFEVITGLQYCLRKDFPLNDSTLLTPSNGNPLVQGEWLEVNSSQELIRGSGEGAALSYPVHTEKGRSDVQSLGKASVIFMGAFEAETTVFYPTSLVAGDFLTVQDVSHESLTRRGLKEKSGSSGGIIVVGIVTKVISATKIRFIHHGYQIVF